MKRRFLFFPFFFFLLKGFVRLAATSIGISQLIFPVAYDVNVAQRLIVFLST